MMWQTAFVSSCTAALAVVGYHLGVTIHGSAAASAMVPALAGGAGGFGIGWAGLDVARRWRAGAAAQRSSAAPVA